MTTTAPIPTPAHQLSTPSTTTTTTPDLNPQGLPIPRGSVTARLNFYAAPTDGSQPHNYVTPLPGVPQRNFADDWRSVMISDLRGHEDEFTLEKNAFEILRGIESAETEFKDEKRIREVYYPEVEKLLLDNLPGAHKVILFDHTIRRPGTSRTAVQRVHIDQTPSSAAARVRLHAPEDAERLLAGRYSIINIWRPLNPPILASPLAVADSASVSDADLIPVEHRYPDRKGETAAVRYADGQRWWYLSGMQADERLALKCFDSDEMAGERGRVPHTAFEDPRTPEGAWGRESIEVRALVFG